MSGSRALAGVLSAEDRERFDRDGYLMFDPEVPDDVLDGILGELDGLFNVREQPRTDEHGVLYGGGPSPRIKNAWLAYDNARELSLAPKVLAVAEALHGRGVLPFQTINFMLGSEQPPHADSMHFQSDPPGLMCGVWVALEDIDRDNGALMYFPGSHKLPL